MTAGATLPANECRFGSNIMPESESLLVIKIGGSTLGAEDTTLDDVVSLQREGVPLVVVHGGGPAVTEWMDRQGLQARFVRGLRVTDEASLEIVVAVLAGLVNKQLVAEVNARGGHAAGICGADGPTILAEVTDPDYGRVGQVREVRTRLLKTLLSAGTIPFLSPVGLEMTTAPSPEPSPAERGRGAFSRNGEADSPLPRGAGEGAASASPLLNINADTVAGEVAAALGATRLVFLTDVPGVKGATGDLVAALTADECAALIESGAIGGGMIPKVEACLRAADAGAEALIVDGRQPHALRAALSGSASGTRVG
jgi:acetylglutamate kinase